MFSKKFIVALVILLVPFYLFFLVPHYHACLATGTDKGTCIHTWLYRF
jgi:hypothetical protein